VSGDLRTLNTDLARVLGVGDVSNVRKVTLTLEPHALPTVVVERLYLPGAAGNKLVDQLSTAVCVHRLKPSEPTEEQAPLA
jgi:hypothetical protein